MKVVSFFSSRASGLGFTGAKSLCEPASVALILALLILTTACQGCGRRNADGAVPSRAERHEQPDRSTSAHLDPGDHTFTIRHDGILRRYLVHMPSGIRSDSRIPLIVMFHGGGASAQITQKHYGWDALADSEGFMVAYPDGTGGFMNRVGNTWNAGTCCGAAWENKVDDIGFVLALFDDLAIRHNFDATRIYVAGHSNGGMMAYHVARNATDRIAAMVSVAGCSFDPTTIRTRPVPVLHIHSADDPRAPWGGGSVRDSGRGTPVMHGILDDSLVWWRNNNGCVDSPRRTRLGSWTHSNGGVHTAEKIEWTGGREGSEVTLIRLTGAGHAWPGADALLSERRMGPNTKVINATQVAWRFLKRFRRASIGQ